MNVRPNIKNVAVTKHFFRDLKNADKVQSTVRDVLDCTNAYFVELHKFEENIEGNMIFRAKKDGVHIVYCVDRSMRIIFLRAFKNFKEYERFLEDKKELHKLIMHK